MGATSMVRGGVTRFLPRRESLGCEKLQLGVGDVEFEFLDDGEMMMSLVKSDESSGDEFRQSNEMELDDDDDGERVDGGSVEENRSFWDNQHQLLQVILTWHVLDYLILSLFDLLNRSMLIHAKEKFIN